MDRKFYCRYQTKMCKNKQKTYILQRKVKRSKWEENRLIKFESALRKKENLKNNAG